MWLAGASYLDENMRLRQGDIHVGALGKIDEVSKPESTALSDDETLDCSETLILPGLVNAHFHSQASLLRGLMRDMRLEDWGGSGAQGALQKRGFRYRDEEATEEEFRIILAILLWAKSTDHIPVGDKTQWARRLWEDVARGFAFHPPFPQ